MAKPARREGTPTHKNRKNHSNHAHGFTDIQRSRSRRDSGAKMEASNVHVKDIYVFNARPTCHQYADSDRRGSGKRAHSKIGEGVRLQKVLVQAGAAPCHMVEKLIGEDRVEIDGKIVMRQGVRVDPNTSVTRADGSRVIVNEDIQYFVLSRPHGVQSTIHDDMNRPCVGDIIGEKISAGQRLFHMGRLGATTEGLLLLINDGELVNRLMHPSHEATKTCTATVVGEVDSKAMCELGKGIELDDGIAKADMAQTVDVWQGRPIVRIELHGGREHIVYRALKTTGFPIKRLVCTKIHTAQLDEQTPGAL